MKRWIVVVLLGFISCSRDFPGFKKGLLQGHKFRESLAQFLLLEPAVKIDKTTGIYWRIDQISFCSEDFYLLFEFQKGILIAVNFVSVKSWTEVSIPAVVTYGVVDDCLNFMLEREDSDFDKVNYPKYLSYEIEEFNQIYRSDKMNVTLRLFQAEPGYIRVNVRVLPEPIIPCIRFNGIRTRGIY